MGMGMGIGVGGGGMRVEIFRGKTRKEGEIGTHKSPFLLFPRELAPCRVAALRSWAPRSSSQRLEEAAEPRGSPSDNPVLKRFVDPL